MSNTNTIPSLVRELRQRLGLTQEELAKHLGVRFQTVNRWERGRVNPLSDRAGQMGDAIASLQLLALAVSGAN